jgi:hypothetical protein
VGLFFRVEVQPQADEGSKRSVAAEAEDKQLERTVEGEIERREKRGVE